MTDVFTPPTDAPASNPVESLVGEGKKFKTVEDLAKAKIEADAFIERLKQEAAAMRSEIDARAKAEDQLAAMREEIKQLRETGRTAPREQTTPALTEADVRNLIARTISDEERNRTATQNILTANDKAIEHFGSPEEASKAVKAKAAELGVGVEWLKNIAQTSPTAFLEIVLPNTAPRTELPVIKNVMQPGTNMTPQNIREGTKEYFDAQYKTKSGGYKPEYFRPEVQQRIWDAVKAGTYSVA